MRTPEETGESIKAIVEAMNEIALEEIDSMLRAIRTDEAMGPLTDPTRWARDGLFLASRDTKKVLEAIRSFKLEVSGIGNFSEAS